MNAARFVDINAFNSWCFNCPRGDSIDDPFRIIESARFETYTLIEADRGKYIRCGVSSRDNTGINSSFKPSETIGPIK